MQEIFYEECSKITDEKTEKLKYNLLLTIGILSYVASFIWFFVCFYIYDITVSSLLFNILVMVVPFIIFIVSGVICFKFKNIFYVYKVIDILIFICYQQDFSYFNLIIHKKVLTLYLEVRTFLCYWCG